MCENPRVLEAVAQRGVTDVGVVCTSGRRSLVASEILDRLCASGAQLRYHGDFDWPGVAMANQRLVGIGAEPWLMSALEYLAAPADLPLSGADVEPLWDAEPGTAMRTRGCWPGSDSPSMSERRTCAEH